MKMKFQRVGDWSRRHPIEAGGFVFFAAVVLIFFAFDSYTRLRLRSEIRMLERQGIACDVAGFARRQRNSGASEELTREFQALCDAIPTEGFQYADSDSCMKYPEGNAPQKFLSERAGALRAADRFLDEHPDLTLWHDCSGTFLWQIVQSDKFRTRFYGKWNHDRFFRALRQRDPAEAGRIFDRSATLRNYMLREAELIGFMFTAQAIEVSRQDALFEAAFDAELELFDAETLKRWADSMPDVEAKFRSGFSRELAGELGIVAEAARNPGIYSALYENPEWATALYRGILGPVLRLDGASAIRVWREMLLPLASEDYTPETVRKLTLYRDFLSSRRRTSPFLAPVTHLFLADASPLFRRISAMYARCRILRTGLAVELFRRRYGRLPETLAELVPEFLPAVPVSPFSGKPLRLETGTLDFYLPGTETTGKFTGYRVYSDGDPEQLPVGQTRVDRRGSIPAWNRAMKRRTP